LRSRRMENMSAAIRRRTGSVLFAGILALGALYGLNALCNHLGRAEATAEIVVGVIFLMIASAGATGVGSLVADLAFPETRGAATMLAGILALSFLEMVPLLGFAVAAAGLWLSLGTAVASGFGRDRSGTPEPASSVAVHPPL
jgi:hypothetical protein